MLVYNLYKIGEKIRECNFLEVAVFKKKIILCILLLSVCLNNIYSDDGGEYKRNIIFAGVSTSVEGLIMGIFFRSPLSVIGLNVEYERSFNDKFSIAIDAGFDAGLAPMIYPYVEIKGRWYPWSKTFFVGLGVGISGFIPSMYGIANVENEIFPSISPTIGWRIDIGNKNKWVIMPTITNRIFIFPQMSGWDAVGERFILNFSVGYRF